MAKKNAFKARVRAENRAVSGEGGVLISRKTCFAGVVKSKLACASGASGYHDFCISAHPQHAHENRQRRPRPHRNLPLPRREAHRRHHEF
jgi:hypothetical protein